MFNRKGYEGRAPSDLMRASGLVKGGLFADLTEQKFRRCEFWDGPEGRLLGNRHAAMSHAEFVVGGAGLKRLRHAAKLSDRTGPAFPDMLTRGSE